jgi:malate dehydrogenase (oxaloacetate-decarboxylating)(NADP+)
MKPVFAAAKKAPRRVIYCEGEDERVLRAVQAVVDEGLAQPVLIGRPDVIACASRSSACASRCRGATSSWSIRHSDPRYKELWQDYHRLMGARA